MPSAVELLQKDLLDGNVLVIVGAGVSIAAAPTQPCASWTGLLKSGIERCSQVTGVPYASWSATLAEQIESGDLISMLSAAQEICDRLEPGELRAWLRDTVGSLTVEDPSVLSAITSLRCPIATTNYDDLISRHSGRAVSVWKSHSDVGQWYRDDNSSILHLHGHWKSPESVVFGRLSYYQILNDEHAQTVFRQCLLSRSLLFVGFGQGLTDPNFEALLEWSRKHLVDVEYRHYRLVLSRHLGRAFEQHAKDRITPIAFGDEYSDLATFLQDLALATTAPNEIPTSPQPAQGRSDLLRRRDQALSRQSELSPDTFISELHSACSALCATGYRKIAINSIRSHFERHYDSLLNTTRQKAGLDLAEWFLDDRDELFARQLLTKLQSDNSLVGAIPSVKRRNSILSAECEYLHLNIESTLDNLVEALSFADSNADRDRIAIKSIEYAFLLGGANDIIILLDRLKPLCSRPVEDYAMGVCLGSQGDTTSAVLRFDTFSETISDTQLSCLAKLRTAELLYLNHQEEEAAERINNLISDCQEKSPDDSALTATLIRNLAELGFSLSTPQAAESFYTQIDEERLTGVSLFNSQAIADAHQHSSAGRHYDALPLLLSEVNRSRALGCWAVWHYASRHFSRECLSIGLAKDAFRYSIWSNSVDDAREAAAVLLERQDRIEIDYAIDWMLGNANAPRLASTALCAVEVLADGISEDHVPIVIQWALTLTQAPVRHYYHSFLTRNGWKALASLSCRASKDDAERILEACINHPLWKRAHPDRTYISRCLSAIVPTLSTDSVDSLCLSLAHAVKQCLGNSPEDREELIGAFVSAAKTCNEGTRKQASDIVFTEGYQLPPELAVLADDVVGKDWKVKDRDAWADVIISKIGSQIVEIGPDDHNDQLKGSPVVTVPLGDGRTRKIALYDYWDVNAAIAQPRLTSSEKFLEIIEALLERLSVSGDVLSNYSQIIFKIRGASPRLNLPLAQKAIAVILPFARGKIPDNAFDYTESSPLSRYRVSLGVPSDLHYASLLALARLCVHHPTAFRRVIAAAISESLVHRSATVRQGALQAWAEIPSRVSDGKVHALTQTADGDLAVARQAIHAISIAIGNGLKMTKVEQQVLTGRLRVAANSPDANSRWNVARAVVGLLSNESVSMIHGELECIRQSLINDICYSVRRQVSGDL